ncbi:hypothetical protein BGX34_011584 [Mortierella sp. NVP85]|nr:hypothetical protein BGX34_011584 [Mortierella sp. NVP85]
MQVTYHHADGEDIQALIEESSLTLDHEGSQTPEQSLVDDSKESRLHLEIQEIASSHPTDGDNMASVAPRRFTFLPNAQLLLGRAPSGGPEAKARLLQHLLHANQLSSCERAQADDGSSDGLFANQVISKIHAAIYEEDGRLVLEDQHSTHGTYVNGRKIERRVLQDSDRVRLGRVVVRKDVPYLPLEFIVRIRDADGNTWLSDNHTTFVDASTTEAVILESESVDTRNTKKRKFSEDDAPIAKKRTALVVAALAGVVVGSVGTVLTLASM